MKVFREKHGINLMDEDYVVELQELRRQSENVKKSLSQRKESSIHISCNGIRETITITREQFNEMILSLYMETEKTVKKVLMQANMKAEDLDKILLVGGSTRILLISERLEAAFGIKPSKEVNPDEVVALGAAVQGKLLGEDVEEKNREKLIDEKIRIIDVSSHSIGIVSIDHISGDKVNTIILKRNSPLPARRKRSFFTSIDDQQAFKLQVTEGEERDIDSVTIIGDFEIKIPPDLKRDTQVDIEIVLDENQIIHVFTRIPTKSEFFDEVHIERGSNLRPSEIERKKTIVSKIDVE